MVKMVKKFNLGKDDLEGYEKWLLKENKNRNDLSLLEYLSIGDSSAKEIFDKIKSGELSEENITFVKKSEHEKSYDFVDEGIKQIIIALAMIGEYKEEIEDDFSKLKKSELHSITELVIGKYGDTFINIVIDVLIKMNSILSERENEND